MEVNQTTSSGKKKNEQLQSNQFTGKGDTD